MDLNDTYFVLAYFLCQNQWDNCKMQRASVYVQRIYLVTLYHVDYSDYSLQSSEICEACICTFMVLQLLKSSTIDIAESRVQNYCLNQHHDQGQSSSGIMIVIERDEEAITNLYIPEADFVRILSASVKMILVS